MKIVVSEALDFAPEARRILEALGMVTVADYERPELLAAVADADVLWVRLRHRIDAEVFAAAPRLRLLATPTTGLTHVDLDAAAAHGVTVVSLKGEVDFLRNVRATAEHTLGLMLALLRHLPAAALHAAEGGWERDRFKGHELYGRTVGVVGYGRLGRLVARYLTAFDAHVLAADPFVAPGDVDAGIRLVPLDALLAESDLVTLHVNHSPATHHFFGADQFAAMKPGAWFVNTARGELVDEAALLDALERGPLRGAALDVLDGETPAGMAAHPVVQYARTHPNVLLSPHLGGCTYDSLEKTEAFLAAKVARTLAALGPRTA